MTNWLPDITGGSGPLYCRLADSIEEAITGGELAPGEKLPPLRNLAFDIGVTVGTVSRAYALARERGLVSGEVGRGTYVLETGPGRGGDSLVPVGDKLLTGTRAISTSDDDVVRMNTTAAPDVGQGPIIREMLADVADGNLDDVMSYIHRVPLSWQEAGCRWLATNSWQPKPENVKLVWGGHAGLLAVIAAATSPGDRIVVDELTYAPLARSAAAIGRRIVTMRMDEHGTIPEDFESVCAQQHPKLAFIIPNYHNPAAVSLSAERRARIVEIAQRYNVWLLEDVVYDSLEQSGLPRLAELAPERTFVVSTLSKAVVAGARGGWIASPQHMAQRVDIIHRLLSGGKPFLIAELSARLVLSGEADAIRQRSREEISSRLQIVKGILAGYDFRSQPHCPFVWLKLPEPWQSTAFRVAAEQEGILIDDEEEHKPARTERSFHRVRIGFTKPDRQSMTDSLHKLRELIERGPETGDIYT